MGLSVDASNACIPVEYPVERLCPPLPTAIRGETLVVDGQGGRLNQDKSLLVYPSNKLVIVRDLSLSSSNSNPIQAFCYRGHTAQVTVAKFSPSGAYVASGDAKGKLRVWSYDNDEHLPKLTLQALNGPIRDLDWDFESKRLVIVGEIDGGGAERAASECTRVITWDVGTSLGTTAPHARKRSSTCAFKPSRPMRIVTGGKDDSKLLFHAGPPFKRIVDGTPSEDCHTKNAVTCVRYNHSGSHVVSVGSDKSIHLYDGKTLQNLDSLTNAHDGTIYSCSWSSDDHYVMTCSADGTMKLFQIGQEDDHPTLKLVQTAHAVLDQPHTKTTTTTTTTTTTAKVPIGAMQMGCAFTKDDVPVSVSLNGQITILPQPPICGGPEQGLIQVLTGHTAPMAAFVMDHTRQLAYTGDTDGIVCQWDLQTGRPLQRIHATNNNHDLMGKLHKGSISCLTIVPTTGHLFSAGWDDTLRISNSQGKIIEPLAQKLQAQPNAMSTGTTLTVIMTVEGLLLVNALDGTLISDTLHSLQGEGGGPQHYNPLCVCITRDDSTIYVGGDDCQIHVYHVQDGGKSPLTLLKVYSNLHLKPIHAISISPDQTKLASADVRDVCVTDLCASCDDDNDDTTTPPPLVGKGRWCFHTQRITCLAWHPHGTYLASGGLDDQIFIWNLHQKMKRIHYKLAHRGGVTGLAFWQSSTTTTANTNTNTTVVKLVSVGADSCFVTWDVQQDMDKKF